MVNQFKGGKGYEKKKIVQTAGRDGLGTFAPDFARYNDDILFGEVWNDESIDLKTKSTIVISVLMGRGLADSSLKYHLMTAKKNGITKEEIAAIITHAAFYAGCVSDIIGLNRAA